MSDITVEVDPQNVVGPEDEEEAPSPLPPEVPQYVEVTDGFLPEVINNITPAHLRQFECTCESCHAQIRFKTKHVNYEQRYWGMMDFFTLQCPICAEFIDIGEGIEPWVRRVIAASDAPRRR